MNFMSVVNDLGTSVKKNSYGILLVTGVIGFVGGGVLAVMSTPKALTLIEAKKEEEGVDDLSAVDTVKTVWKCYIPAVATFVLSAGCIVLASNINHRRNAALMTAYAISEGALKEYHDKVVEVVGDKKEKEIKDAIASDRMHKDPVTRKEVIITKDGNTLCYDPLSGRYFRSDMESLRRVSNRIGMFMRNDNLVTLNELYDEMGLSHIDVGEYLCWDVDHGYMELEFSSQLAEDGTPCLVVMCSRQPKYLN